MPTGTRLEGIRKIAVVRANGVGDYCFAIPALTAVRAAYPDAEIVLLGKAWHHEFLRDRPGPIDRVVVIPPYGGVSAAPGTPEDARVLSEFFQRMRAERFDLALQLHGGGRYSNPFTRALGARVSVGLRAPDAEPLDRCIPYVYFQPEILRYLEVVALVGARAVTLEPALALTPADVAEFERLQLGGAPIAVLHPGATDSRRHWPAENFAAVGEALANAGARVVINGMGAEAALTRAIAECLGSCAVDLSDRLALGGLAALLARAHVVVANDSGPLHLAAAVGTPTVGIFWCFNMINGGLPTRARHRPAISWRVNCVVCGRNTLTDNCAHTASFVADVPVAEVTAAALELFKESTRAETPPLRSVAQ